MRKLLPHATIIISAMYLVFFVIDIFNEPMAFVNNRMTKALLLVMCAISTVNAVALIQSDREKERKRQKKLKKKLSDMRKNAESLAE